MAAGIVFTFAACNGSKKKDDYTDRMSQEHEGDSPVQNASVQYKQQQPVDTQSVKYAQTDSGAVTGYYAEPKNAGQDLPGLIVIHEWWGLNDNIRMMTRRLAGLGLKALAVDLYHGKTADSPQKAHALMEEAQSNHAGQIDNLKQAYQYLHKQGARKIGVIGWCFGGGWALQTALAMPDKIDATIIYYGELVTDKNQLRKLDMPIIGFFGGQDQSIPPAKVKTFKNNLQSLNKNVQIYTYQYAGHAFANPSGTRYNKKAAQDAWNKTKDFLQQYLEE